MADVSLLLGLVPARVWLFGGIAVAILVALALAGSALYSAGRKAERAGALQKSIEVLRERKSTNEAVRDLDDAHLCVALGGMWRDGECL